MAQKRPLDDPLDETVFRSEAMLIHSQGIHDNSILFYFAESPFFDKTSNNNIVYTQAALNQHLQHTIANRPAFEAELDKRYGQEYRVAEKPAETSPGMGTGVWVLRRQFRALEEGREKTKVRETFFLCGERVYQAPSVADVLGSSLLSITTSLNKFMAKAATLPEFSPSHGYTYPALDSTKDKFTDTSQRSKEATPMPDSQTSAKSITHTQTDDYISNQLLADTIGIAMRYGDEYMDEVPVTGQPGEFRLSTKKQDSNKLAVPDVVTKAGTSTPKPNELPALKTDVSVQQRKLSKGDKSPKTPGGGPPKPKRRKSKVQVTTPGGTNAT